MLFWVRLLWQRPYIMSHPAGRPPSFQTREWNRLNRPLELHKVLMLWDLFSFFNPGWASTSSASCQSQIFLSAYQWLKKLLSGHYCSQWNEYLMLNTSYGTETAINGRFTREKRWTSHGQCGGEGGVSHWFASWLNSESRNSLSFDSRFYNWWFRNCVMLVWNSKT